MEAEALLASVRERQRPFPVLKPGPGLAQLEGLVLPLALRAADQLIREERPRYNPLFLWCDPPEAARAVLGATARTYVEVSGGKPAAVTSVAQLAEDFIRALSAGVVGAWRERWWTVDMLLVHGIEALAQTERVQDEFFHLFEALKRRGSRIFVASDRPPVKLEGIDERLRSRFEGGLVLQLIASALPAGATELAVDEAPALARDGWEDHGAQVNEVEFSAGPTAERGVPAPTASAEPSAIKWLPSPENVVWTWPRLDERIVEELE